MNLNSMDETVRSLIKNAIVQYDGAYSQTGLPHGFGAATFVNDCHYDGAWKHGSMHGRGTVSFLDGLTYYGQMHNSSITGKGIYTWPNGVYEGDVEEGVPHGVGRMLSKKEGVEYKGEWNRGKRHGNGTLTIENVEGKTIYEGKVQFGWCTFVVLGEWSDDFQHGVGSVIYPSGNRYDGEWVQGKKQGLGTMQWFDKKEEYEGEWKANIMHGQGEYTWFIRGLNPSTLSKSHFFKRHNKYIGDFVDGKKEGLGRLLYGDGRIYEGEFLQDRKHGIGLYLTELGELHKGQFVKDRIKESCFLKAIQINSHATNSLLDLLNNDEKQQEQIAKLIDMAKRYSSA